METPLQKLKRVHNLSFITDEMLEEEKEHFKDTFKSGWLRCNAMSYNEDHFDYYWNLNYKNNEN